MENLPRWASGSIIAFSAGCGCVLAGILGGAAVKHLVPGGDITYADFIVIILTALAVILAALTIFVGIFAFLGWTTISGGALQKAEAVVAKELGEGGKLEKLVLEKLDSLRYKGVGPLDDDDQSGEDS